MNRRDALLALSAYGSALLPLHSGAQVVQTRRIGLLLPGTRALYISYLDALATRLRELGWEPGRNITLDARYADNHHDRLTSLAREMVEQKFDMIITGSSPAAVAMKQASSSVPVVFTAVADPVALGLVQSLARPGGNMTGYSMLIVDFATKQVELLKELQPQLQRFAAMLRPNHPANRQLIPQLENAAKIARATLLIVDAVSLETIETAFVKAVAERATAMVIPPDPLYGIHRVRIAQLALQHRIATAFSTSGFVRSGGLLSYGPDLTHEFASAAQYIDKILRGAKPADLPVEQAGRFLTVINRGTARALGLTIPQSVLLRADEVIE